MCTDICTRTPFVPGSEQFSASEAGGNFEFRVTDNVKGQISVHIFGRQMGAIVFFYP